ncbi:MAG: sensor histidine kinase [Spirochaetes bacterium]|uniref:histidine kinase n=1 Tax=Candidatus Ornithospirochaeta stercoripullorum TaxID=2840899 RepID=A0A9D9H5P8_9SPIO|nr:sensor histidine kinase [Candidatus Ornithospirochaeta stercoripullorum]
MKREHRPLSIRTLIAISTTATISFFVLVVGLVVTILVSGAIEDNAMQSATEIVTQVNNNLSTYINDIIDVSDYIRELARTSSSLENDSIMTRLEALVSSRDDLVGISVFSTDGNMLISTRPAIYDSKDSIASELWFSRALGGEGDFFFTGPQRSSLGGNGYVISYSTTISYRAMSKAIPAVLLIELNFNAVAELLDSAHLSDTGYIYIISNDGDLVYHPKQRIMDDVLQHEDLESINEHVFGSYISTFEGRERLTIIQTVGHTRWRLVGIAFMDELLEPLKLFRITLVAIMFFSIIVLIITSSLIAMHITRPLRELETNMRRVRDGDFTFTAPHYGSKEVESLSRSFELMIIRIEELMDKVRTTEALKRQRELDALQAKINPHFLYNTLDSVVWMAESGDNQGVVKMVTALASLFRISIAKGHDIITLKEELSHVESYLDIQSMRYRDKFRFTIDLPKELENTPTIKLIIQPIVENSIYHGIKYLQEEGLIEIKVRAEGDNIEIIIHDNGIGMDEETKASLTKKNRDRKHLTDGNGIGIENIDERIKLSYGNEYGLKIESELDEGTTVTITIPHLEPIQPVVKKNI